MTEVNKPYQLVMVDLLLNVNADEKVVANFQRYSKYNIPDKCLPTEYRRKSVAFWEKMESFRKGLVNLVFTKTLIYFLLIKDGKPI